jgi:hypothetical protein
VFSLGLLGCGSATPVVAAPDASTPASDGAVLDAPTVDAPAVDAAPVCPGPRGKRECLTFAQVEARIRNPPGEFRPPVDAGPGDGGLAPLDVPLAPNGCYAPRYVQSGCCNPALAVEREGDQCCYLWCDMACCGRPMVVAGEARAAPMVPASAWTAQPAGVVAGLDAATRAALGLRRHRTSAAPDLATLMEMITPVDLPAIQLELRARRDLEAATAASTEVALSAE